MAIHQTLPALALALLITAPAAAQNTLKDGTSLSWNKEINTVATTLKTDSAELPALSVPVFEAKASEVWSMLKTELPGASFKKQGKLMRADAVAMGSGPAVDVLAQVEENKKQNSSTLTVAFLATGTNRPAEDDAHPAAMRDLGVRLNKAVVKKQLDEWTKKLGKADSKTASAAKSQDKAQARVNKANSQMEKILKEKGKLQNQQAVLQKEIDLYNQKWTLSQDPKDFKKLTKSRAKITKNDAKMAKLMDKETKAQKELSKSTAELPDAQKAKDQKAGAQAEVQRTVDALQRKLDSIR